MKINKQLILTAGAVTSMCVAVGTAIFFTPKAEVAIKAKKKDLDWNNRIKYTDEGHVMVVDNKPTAKDKFELVKASAKYYIPTAVGLTAGIACVIAKDVLHKKELALLSASAAATTSYLVANRDKLKKLSEKPEVKKVVKSIFPTKEEFKHQTIEETGNGDLLCIEGYSGRIFRSSREAVEEAQKQLSKQYIEDKYCCYNDYYRNLNILETQFGYDHGWANNEDWYYKNEKIEFRNEIIPSDAEGNEFGEDILCADLEPEWYPMECWMEV